MIDTSPLTNNSMLVHFNTGSYLIEDHKRRTVPLARFRGIKFKDPSIY